MDQSVIDLSVAPALDTGRVDLYTVIHKAMRLCIVDALQRVGRMEPSDDTEVADTMAQVRDMLDLCTSHLEHENRFLHTAMQARMPGSTERADDDHVGHVQAIAALREQVDALARSAGTARAQAALRLYRRLALFVAENLEHMHHEETHNMAVLWDCYTDAELAAIEEAILAAIEPPKMARFLHWIIPALAHGERVGMLSAMRDSAPPQAFAGAMTIARDRLAARDWQRLSQALGVETTSAGLAQ